MIQGTEIKGTCIGCKQITGKSMERICKGSSKSKGNNDKSDNIISGRSY